MGAWDMLIAIPKDTEFLDVANAVDRAMMRWPEQWDWYAVGGRGWEPAAYIDQSGEWHTHRHNQSIEQWREQVSVWRGSVGATGYRLQTVRCKG